MTTDARLRAFVAVAETGSVRAAAQRLVVTESALTRDVGAPLLEREGRGLRLTASRQTYAGYARTILGLHAEALATARGEGRPGARAGTARGGDDRGRARAARGAGVVPRGARSPTRGSRRRPRCSSRTCWPSRAPRKTAGIFRRGTAILVPGRHASGRHLVDGERWENGDQADGYEPNPYGGVDSVVVVE